MSELPPATTSDDTTSLEERVLHLEAENARLARLAEDEPATGSGTRWRALLSALCIVIAAILIPVSIVTGWARVQLVDEDAFVGTLAPLVDDAAVQDLIIDETMQAITARVDFHELTGQVFDGVIDLGLPPRAGDALSLLQGPAADGLQNLVNQAITRVVVSDAFSDVWATATRGAHRALTTAATSDGGGIVVRTEDGVGIQLGVIVDQVKTNLVEQGVSIATLIPAVDRVIIVGEGSTLAGVRTGYALATAVGWWLPVVSLAFLALGILLARRRSVAIVGSGLALAIGAGALAATFSIGRTAIGLLAGEIDLSPSALEVIYGQFVDGMTQTAVVLSLLGVFVVVLGWLMGRSKGASAVRGTVRSLNATTRRELRSRGLETGAFGAWIAQRRVLVRTVIAILAVVWLLAMRPLSFGDVVLVVVLAAIVAWALELLQKRPDEEPDVIVVDDDTSTPADALR